MRVLIVDDQSSIRALIKAVLRSMDINDIDEAGNGAQALAKLRDGKAFQLMITDWYMPELSGIDLLREVRADADLHALRVIMLTSEHDRDHILAVTALQVHGYVVKPFKPETLIKSVQSALRAAPAKLIAKPPPAEVAPAEVPPPKD